MKTSVILIILTTVLFASCNTYEAPNDGITPAPVYPSYEVGDYYHNDTLQGIVFHTIAGGSSGLMVSLDETLLPWCTPSHINEETGVTNPYDGWYNTNTLMANYDLCNYPAVQWSHQKNTWHLVPQSLQITRKQWYVPASSELRYLLLNQDRVNATLESLGYPTLEGKTFWTSTETGTRSASAGFMQDDEFVIHDSLKTQSFYVRAIRNF